MKPCGLCAAYSEDARVIYSNDHAVSVVINNPVNRGHVMIMPKEHRLRLTEMGGDEAVGLNQAIYETQTILQGHFPTARIVHGLQRGKHSTEPHIHYQMAPVTAYSVTDLYRRAHNPDGTMIKLRRELTHPEGAIQADLAERLRTTVSAVSPERILAEAGPGTHILRQEGYAIAQPPYDSVRTFLPKNDRAVHMGISPVTNLRLQSLREEAALDINKLLDEEEHKILTAQGLSSPTDDKPNARPPIHAMMFGSSDYHLFTSDAHLRIMFALANPEHRND